MTTREIIDEIVTACALELFGPHDTEVARGDKRLDPHEYVSVIGFYGSSMHGALGLGDDRGVIGLMMNGPTGDFCQRSLAEDWVGETANQLLGRIKNKLLAYDVTVGLGVPMVLRGVEVHLATSTSDVWHYRFVCPQGGLTVWFDCRMDEALVLERSEAPDLVAREGELTMF